jgi:hypothetical protein
VLDAEGAAHDVEELVTSVLVEVIVVEFARLELGQVGVELTFGDEVAEALEVIAGMLDAGLREADAIGGTVDAKERERDGAEEIVEVLAEDHRDAGEVAEGGNDTSGLELGEEAGGEAGMAAEFGESEGGFLAKGADAQADALLGDERFDGVTSHLNAGVVLRQCGRVLLLGKKNFFGKSRRRNRG